MVTKTISQKRNLQVGAVILGTIACFTAAHPCCAAVFVQPALSGASPSGIDWSVVAAGTAMPIRSASTPAMNGKPGAVAYFDPQTGLLQIDPKGLSLSNIIFTYTSGTTNVTGTTPGPFTFTSGTTTNSISPAVGSPRTFPAVTAVTGLAPTTVPARVGMIIGAPLGPALATSGDAGNIASDNGFFNQPWAFPDDLVSLDSLATMTISDFMTVGQTTNANINILGYGNGRATFQYSINGVGGNQVGPVIPVLVPEPSSIGFALVGAGLVLRRRRSAKA